MAGLWGRARAGATSRKAAARGSWGGEDAAAVVVAQGSTCGRPLAGFGPAARHALARLRFRQPGEAHQPAAKPLGLFVARQRHIPGRRVDAAEVGEPGVWEGLEEVGEAAPPLRLQLLRIEPARRL